MDDALRQRALMHMQWAFGHRRLNIEALQFAADHITLSDVQIVYYWQSLIEEISMVRQNPDETRDARWLTDPGEVLRQTGFHRALEEGHWVAIWLAAAYAEMKLSELRFEKENPNNSRFQRLYRALIHGQKPAEEDIVELAQLILKNQHQSPYLQPLLRHCTARCGEKHPHCITLGVVNGLFDTPGLMYLEPIVDARSYYASPRSSERFLASLRERLRYGSFLADLLPKCALVDPN